MSMHRGAHRIPGSSPGTVAAEGDEVIPEFDSDTDIDLLHRFQEIGTSALPALETLVERLSSIDGAMLCTADGYNLCALGLDENQVGRLAALTSTLFSVSRGAMEAVAQSSHSVGAPLEQVTLRSGETQCLVFPIQHDRLGYVILCLWAERTGLGELLMEARITAREIADILRIED